MGDGYPSLLAGMCRVSSPVLVLGVTSDVLFPIEQQRQMAALLTEAGLLHAGVGVVNSLGVVNIPVCSAGNDKVTFYELSSIYGHDTFMLDVNNLGVAVKVIKLNKVYSVSSHTPL